MAQHGPPKHSTWEHFHMDSKHYKTDKSHKNGWCLVELRLRVEMMRQADKEALADHLIPAARSEEQLLTEALKLVEPICGKAKQLLQHLRDCEHIIEETKQRAHEELENPKERTGGRVSGPRGAQKRRGLSDGMNLDSSPIIDLMDEPAAKHQKTQLQLQVVATKKFNVGCQQEITRDLCDLFVACGIPWNAAANPELEKFFKKWIPGAEIPDRQKLAGPVLKERVAQVESDMRKRIEGKLAMGQCDGWKNISKTLLVATMLTVEYQTHTLHVHNIGADQKTAENLLKLVKDISFVEETLKVTVIGWCSNPGGDSRAMQERLYKLMPWLVCIDCWAHQINLVAGDYFKIKLDFIQAADDALQVIKWFNNHSRALGILRQEQMVTDNKVVALILPVIMRWTSHYLAMSWLLDVNKSLCSCVIKHGDVLLECAGPSADAKCRAQGILNIVSDRQFWENITWMHTHLEPLAVATHVSQGTSTHLDQVLLTLANLHHIYGAMDDIDNDVRSAIQGSLEKRWAKADQDAFILAVFFNPYIRARLFRSNNIQLTPAGLYGIVRHVWCRIFRMNEPQFELHAACTDYYHRHREFADAAMHLENHELNLVQLWEQLDTGENTGWNQLVKLAIQVLSIVGNSAGCERLFSEMGLIHTKICNRLGHDKVRDMAVLKMALRHSHVATGYSRRRLKRKLGAMGSDDSPIPGLANDEEVISVAEDPDDNPLDIKSIVRDLVEDADANDHDDLNESDDDLPAPADLVNAPNARPHRIICYFGREAPIPLADLFKYTDDPSSLNTESSQKGLDAFWKGGVVNLWQELELYDLLHADQDEDASEDRINVD